MNKGLFISGKWRPGGGEIFTSHDPANNAMLWCGEASDAQDVDAAFQAARKAFPEWSAATLEMRQELVTRFRGVVLENRDRLARLISRETGKILPDSTSEARAVAGKVDISRRAYDQRTGHSVTDTTFGRCELRHRPHGVFAVFGPYNFPAHLPNGHIIPALIAGNTIVFKPSERTPLAGEFLISLYEQAGFPPGVINLVQGARNTGAAMLDHKELDGVLFTGSASTGAFFHKKFGGCPEIVLALEMGGNNPLLVWDVSDVGAVANLVIHSSFITTGQRCTCARRILLPQGPDGERILEAVVALTDALKIGAWDDTDIPFAGPVIDNETAGRIIKQADALNGSVIRETRKMTRGGAFLKPGIFDVSGLDVPDEEIFGPVMQIIRVRSFEEGIKIANATRFGLSAGLISDDPENWKKFVCKIRAGVVNFNRPTTGAAGFLPFGGPGISGNHNPGAFYSADFCAWPMASQIADHVEAIVSPGLKA